MTVRKVIASGLEAVRSFAARHGKFVTGVGLGSGGAVVFDVARDAAAQCATAFERYGDAFLVRQNLQLDASADMLSIVCASLISVSTVTATGLTALLLHTCMTSSGGSRGVLTVCLCY